MKIYEDFLCKTPNRTGIQKAWSLDNYTYRTNGHVLLRTPREEDIPENEEAPNVVKIFKANYDDLNFHKIPENIKSEDFEKQCSNCNGTGVITVCPECRGRCVVYFENDYNDYEVECMSCNGTGKPEDNICPECYSGKIYNTHKQMGIGNKIFQLRYLYLLNQLPGCLIQICDNPLDSAYFKFKHGDGILMPCKKNPYTDLSKICSE